MTRYAFLLLISAAGLAACHVSKNDGNSDAVTMKGDDSGNVSFNLPFVKGSVKLPEDAIKSGDFDIDGVKMIPGGTIHGFNVNAGDKGSTVHLGFDAPRSPDEVRGYFLDQFKQKSVQAAQSGNAVNGKTSDGDTFAIDVEPASQGSTGTITILSKE